MHSGHTQKLILPFILILCCGSFAQSPIGGYLVPVKNTFGSTIYRGQIVIGDSTNSSLVQPYWAKDASTSTLDSTLGKALTFDATGNIFDSNAVAACDPQVQFSVELWYKRTSTGAGFSGWMFGSRNDYATSGGDWMIGWYGGYDYSGSYSNGLMGTLVCPDDTSWHYVVMIRSSADNKWRFYLDGTKSDSIQGMVWSGTPAKHGMYVGKRFDSFYGFNGTVDEVAFYSGTLLSQDTITAHYRSGVGSYLNRNSGGGSTVIYHFDEGSGSATADSSGNGNDGATAGSPTWRDGKIYTPSTLTNSGGKVLYAIGTVYNDSILNGASGFMTTAGAGYVAVKKNKTASVKPGKRMLFTSDSIGLADCEVPTGTAEDFREIGRPLTTLFAINARGDSICIADIYKN